MPDNSSPNGVYPRRRKRKRLLILLLVVVPLFAVAVYLAYSFDPNAENSYLPPCIFHATTGLHCPGCGATRSLNSLLHGNIATALDFNPLFVALLPFLLIFIVDESYHFVTEKHIISQRLGPGMAWAALVAIVLFGILRNLPFEPFSYLAP
ncbi:MAG: DUF2752 domain-containing protein [Planctomycetota bacterium]|nr:DUF2752 domain-containing protein [Planctomycetota bacterium]